ncbi:Divalent metal cation transporter MntH [Streptomyces tendae]
MADTTGNTSDVGVSGGADRAPRKSSWRYIGPGIVVAATGVGAGDLVATLIAGSNFGYTLLWAAVIGCLVKISLAEACGRWHLATGRTLFDGWASIGSWTTWFFAIYAVIWGFVYGAAAMSSSALPLQALFPDVMGLEWWGIACGLVGLVFVWFNKYNVFEKVMTVLVGVMFVVTVYLAIRVTPHLGDAFAGLLPVLPDEKDSVLNTLGSERHPGEPAGTDQREPPRDTERGAEEGVREEARRPAALSRRPPSPGERGHRCLMPARGAAGADAPAAGTATGPTPH